jgi:hypothetical protein
VVGARGEGQDQGMPESEAVTRFRNMSKNQAGASGRIYGGVFLWRYLASFVDPETVRFSDWSADEASTPGDLRGSVLLVTNTEVIEVTYSGLEGRNLIGSVGVDAPGNAVIRVKPRSALTGVDITADGLNWDGCRLLPGSITLSGKDGWSCQLPFEERTDDGAAYVDRLLSAVRA